MLSGSVNSTITLNLVADDGESSGGVTSHNDLTDLDSDDHTQYFNQSRGDARYVQSSVLTETVQDMVGAMLTAGSHASISYNDAAGTVSIDSIQLTQEEIEDRIGALLSGGANTTVTYNDGANTLIIAETAAGKTQEEIEDIVAGLLAGGTNVTLTYNDAGNSLTIAASGGGGGTTLPSQTGNGGKILTTDGTNLSWVTPTTPISETTAFVTWAGKTNVTEGNLSTLTKTSGNGGAWDAGAYSTQSVVSGNVRVEAVVGKTGASMMIGLSSSSDASSDSSYTTMDFAIFCYIDNTVSVFENGSGAALDESSFPYVYGDKVSVAVENGVVFYRINNTIIRKNTAPTLNYPLKVDCSLQVTNSKWIQPKIITPS